MKTKEAAKCFYFGVGPTYWLALQAFQGLSLFWLTSEVKPNKKMQTKNAKEASLPVNLRGFK